MNTKKIVRGPNPLTANLYTCLLAASLQTACCGTATYSNPFSLKAASSLLPGVKLGLSFGPNGVLDYGSYGSPVILSNVAFSGRWLVVQPPPNQALSYLINFDSDVPLTIRFPAGARAFGAYFSTYGGLLHPTFTATVKTDLGETFTFQSTTDFGTGTPAYFGLVSTNVFHEITYSDGAIVSSAGFPMHQEQIAELYTVVNGVPSLDITPGSLGKLDITVTGSMDETVVLLASTNLVSWQSLATNVLSSGDRWFYTDNQTNSPTGRFYKVLLR